MADKTSSDKTSSIKASPQTIRESSQAFRELVRGGGSAQRYVDAVQRESRYYVSGVRAGRYRSGRTAA